MGVTYFLISIAAALWSIVLLLVYLGFNVRRWMNEYIKVTAKVWNDPDNLPKPPPYVSKEI